MRYRLRNFSDPCGAGCCIVAPLWAAATTGRAPRVACSAARPHPTSCCPPGLAQPRGVTKLHLFLARRNTSKIPAFYLYGRSCFLRVLPRAWGAVMGVGAIRNRCVKSACVAATLFAAPALAAELSVPLPVKAPRPLAVPVTQLYDWTGFYVGVHFGQGWGKSHWTLAPDASGAVNFFNRFDAFETTGGYFGGLQLGYDYMLPNRFFIGGVVDV